MGDIMILKREMVAFITRRKNKNVVIVKYSVKC